MQQFKYLEIFEQYTQNKLTAQGRNNFQERLLHDEDFSAEWLDYQLFLGAMTHKSNKDKSELDTLRQKLEQEGFYEATLKQVESEMGAGAASHAPAVAPAMGTIRGGLWRRWAVAASLAVVLVAGWLWQQSPTRQLAKLDQNELVRISTPRESKGILRNDTLSMVGNLIGKQQFLEAEHLLSQFKGEKDEIYIYLDSYLQFEKGAFDTSINMLKQVVNEASFPSTQWDAEILLARCYIRKNDIAAAKETLKNLLSIIPDKAWETEYSTRQSIAVQYYNNL